MLYRIVGPQDRLKMDQAMERKVRVHFLRHPHQSVGGSVVEFSPATREAAVRFRPDASIFQNFYSYPDMTLD